ncbi:hypothetical protein BLNAU_19611 [Blattamonas nauphoetae]|uniref:Uncharacterized protein n=1 Tax=Blattamonas nauphoetae TaxID=2049346 RepID=A0ABQ9X121_9EUKA|nr:hypothetical protein BLNAU_19611 [Blattamonas nauphoetae]
MISTQWQLLFLVIVSLTSCQHDHVLSLADFSRMMKTETHSGNNITIPVNYGSFHAEHLPLTSTTLNLIGRNSELHLSSSFQSPKSKEFSRPTESSNIHGPTSLLDLRNSSISLHSWILHADIPNTVVCLVSSSQLMVHRSEIISNIHQSPFVISSSNIGQSTNILIISCLHSSKSIDLLPLVDLANHHHNTNRKDIITETVAAKMTRPCVGTLGDDEISVVGSSLDFSNVHFPIGSGPLFSFGMQNDRSLSLKPTDIRVNTMLSSSSLLNVTSSLHPICENQNRFGSVMRQDVVGCCVSRCSNHDSGTTMLDVNLGGNLGCLNTSFSSCIRQSNTAESYPNQNHTQDDRIKHLSGSSTTTSATLTLCTFTNMTGSYADNTGGSAILITSTTSLTVTQCYFHICNVSGENDDGGAIFYGSAVYPNTNEMHITKSSFTECKTIGGATNLGGSIFARDAQQVSITDSYFEKGEASQASAVELFNRVSATMTNCSFVACSATSVATLQIYHESVESTLAYLLFRDCSAVDSPDSRDIYFFAQSFTDIQSNISFCDSMSGAPNVYFRVGYLSDSTLVPQITSTPTVETCTVTISGNEAVVEVKTKEVIGGVMGILLEGCLVPRLVFVQFDINGANSSIGTATVSSGADGILPPATYKRLSHTLRGDIAPQVVSASAILSDVNTTTITVKGVSLDEGSYSMRIQKGSNTFNISLSRTDSTTLVGYAHLYPSNAEERLDWSTQYEVSLVYHKKTTVETEVRRANTIIFSTPNEPSRIVGIWGSLDASGNYTSVTLRGRQIPTGTYDVRLNSADGPSFEVSFADELSEERTSSATSVPIFGPSAILSFDTQYTLFSVTPTTPPSDPLPLHTDPATFTITEPSRLTGVEVSDFSSPQKDSVTLTVSGRALKADTTYTLSVSGEPTPTPSQSNSDSHTTTLSVVSTASSPSESASCPVVLYPVSSADLRYGYSYSINWMKEGSTDLLQNAALSFQTPVEPARIHSFLSHSLNDPKTNVTFSLSGYSLPTGSGSIFAKQSGSAVLVEGVVTVSKATQCSAVFLVDWEESTTHLSFGKTYLVQSASSNSKTIVIDSVVSLVVPSPPVITSFSLPDECSSNSFSVSVVGENLPSGDTYTVSLLSSRSFEITFSTGTSGTGTIKAGLPSEIQFNATYSIESVSKGDKHVLLNQTSLKTPLGPTLEGISTALNSSNKNNALLTLTGSRMIPGTHTLTFVEQGQSTPIIVSVSIDTETTGSGEEVVFGGSKMEYGKTYTISSLTSDTVHYALDGTGTFKGPDEPARIVGIWASLDESGNTTSITLRGRRIVKGSYTVTLNSADGPSFEVSFDDELSEERTSSAASVPIFGPSAILSFDTQYTLFSVTPTDPPSDNLLINANPSSFTTPLELTRIASAFPVLSIDLLTVTVSLSGYAFTHSAFTAELKIVSPTPSNPFTTTANRISNKELQLTLPIQSGTPNIEFGDEIKILSIINSSTEAILDCSIFTIPHPPKVTSAKCDFANTLHTTIQIELTGTDLQASE